MNKNYLITLFSLIIGSTTAFADLTMTPRLGHTNLQVNPSTQKITNYTSTPDGNVTDQEVFDSGSVYHNSPTIGLSLRQDVSDQAGVSMGLEFTKFYSSVDDEATDVSVNIYADYDLSLLTIFAGPSYHRIEVRYDDGEYTDSEDLDFINLDLGIKKSISLASNLTIEPFVRYSTSVRNEEVKDSDSYVIRDEDGSIIASVIQKSSFELAITSMTMGIGAQFSL